PAGGGSRLGRAPRRLRPRRAPRRPHGPGPHRSDCPASDEQIASGRSASKEVAVLHLSNPETIGKPFSRYSHGALVEGQMRWLHISGQVGARPDGTLEQGFEAQARLAWANLIAVLEAGGMARSDLVKVNVLLTRAGD